ncbi:MAG: gshA [Amycolatopsis sp.]|uniref:glutamate-cysteine ligase family protein n=1 Tax=Amycolatopsis sp. TaxID=37632 RepID=UPI00260733A4|nr:glutamate-cysteine ligase family protein [Amycolatopsis sp.]MCU1682959.1 gshA [Amycolatopsis sp.]
MTAVRDFPENTGSAVRQAKASNRTARVLSDRAAGEAYVASVCFKHGPPRLLGVELEFIVHYADDPRRPLNPDDLAAALGDHTPRTLRPESPAEPLPGGSPMSLEPGCQVEISALPQPSLRELVEVVSADLAYLTDRLAGHGLRLGEHGIDAFRPPVRRLQTERYAAMERRFAPIGDGGITMMAATAGLQICLDAGEADQVAARWAAVHAAGPPLLAAFANSRRHAGRDTGYASARWLAVMRTEHVRTFAASASPDPAADWAERILDTPLMVLPRQRPQPWDAPEGVSFADWIAGRGAAGLLDPPTEDDLAYHLTTMFTPVRPQGYLEVRYLDAQPGQQWLEPTALLTALLARPSTVDSLLEVCEPVADRWECAAKFGLDDPEIAAAARKVIDLACAELGTVGLPREQLSQLIEAAQARVRA